jgi:flagellar biosynthetic protein FliO
MGAHQDSSVPAVGVEIPSDLLRDETPPAPGRLEALKKLEDRPLGRSTPDEPGLGGAFAATALVVGLLIGAFLLLRKFMARTPLFASGSAMRILARRPLAPRQEVILVEVGARVLVIGATRESLSRLGEVSGAEEIASLRARCGLPASEPVAAKAVRAAEPSYDGIAEELSRLRTTVRDWSRQEATP